jgi:tetratricopeptide (TPR) repeat protein
MENAIQRFLDPAASDQVTLADWKQLLLSTYQMLITSPDDTRLKVQAKFAQGQVDYLGSNFSEALEGFHSALRLAPDYAPAHYGAGNVYLATNQPLHAVKAFERAVELNPQSWMGYRGLGDAWTVLRKRKEAEAAYARARALGYLSQGVSLTQARDFVRERRWADALVLLEALAVRGSSVEVYILMGDAYVGQGQMINAYLAYTKAVELDPSSAAGYYKLGEIHFRERHYEASLEALERALHLDPGGRLIDREKARRMAMHARAELRKLPDGLKN